ncbi:hypothetical protein L4D20_15000 [Vibrio kyushuensis]|uniref:BatD family protein n=1 Tax=Vibrio kyushuensis TaxID=2910249 RepID=UPI003D12AD39
MMIRVTDRVKTRTHIVLLFLMLTFGALAATKSYAQSNSHQGLNQLLESGDVTLFAWIGKQGESKTFSVSEQVILTVELGTPRWFTAGTQIGRIEVPNVIAMQRNSFAMNFTERKNGQTWSKQRWEITLYPLASGHIVVPPTSVKVQVSGPNGDNVSGVLYTPVLEFNTHLPSGQLTHESQWVAASELSIEQSWDLSSDTLKVGDSITRSVAVKGKDTLSILLPEILNGYGTAPHQRYTHPNSLDDTQTRGQYWSHRAEQETLVLQQGGEFSLPSYQVVWWNTQTEQLEEITIEGKTFKVSHTFSSFIQHYWWKAMLLIGSSAMVVVMLLTVKRYYQSKPLPLWYRFILALKSEDRGELRRLIYLKLRLKSTLKLLSQYRISTEYDSGKNCSEQKKWNANIHDVQREEAPLSLFRWVWQQLSITSICRLPSIIHNRFKKGVVPAALPQVSQGANKGLSEPFSANENGEVRKRTTGK